MKHTEKVDYMMETYGCTKEEAKYFLRNNGGNLEKAIEDMCE